MNVPKRILFASTNPHKIREAFTALEKTPFKSVEWVSLSRYPSFTMPDESGETFADNARLKAVSLSARSGLPTLADDSGLVVPALNGAPGVISARYAGIGATDADNIQKLLKEAQKLRKEDRAAYFVCALCLAFPPAQQEGGQLLTLEAEGRVDGRLLEKPHGEGGFGYDSVFFCTELEKSFGECSAEEKTRVSHRTRALMTLSEVVHKHR
jgi:XTP/dITP diphosphohydrolase